MKMHELLATPNDWTQKAYARDINGQKLTDERDPKAVCFCLVGALNKCYPREQRGAVIRAIAKEGSFSESFTWNDAPERTHAEVLALLKKLDV